MTLHVDRLWHEEQTTVLSVADWAADTGEITSARAMVYFFEKPWKFEELHERFLEHRDQMAEDYWEFRSREP